MTESIVCYARTHSLSPGAPSAKKVLVARESNGYPIDSVQAIGCAPRKSIEIGHVPSKPSEIAFATRCQSSADATESLSRC